MRYSLAFLCLLLQSMPAVSRAQAATPAESSEMVRALLDRIDRLEKRVAELESRSGAPGASTPTAPEAAAPVTQEAAKPNPAEAAPSQLVAEPQMTSGHAGMPQMTAPSPRIEGFSDINFAATDKHGSHSGFNEGQFVLHFNSALSSKVNFMGELSLTARTDAGTGTPAATGFNAEVERAIIQFQQNDYFKVSFGRYHTPINWWNMTFHHGQWLQTTAARPEMVQFGGSFLPIHFVGTLVEGTLPANGMNLNYNFGLGNGRSSVISRAGDWGDINNNKAWLAGLFSRPSGLYGFQFGGSVYRDEITRAAGNQFREWIQSAHVVWQKGDPELIAEFSNVTHREVGAMIQSNSQAWYVQAGYRLPWFEKLWKPYYRFEYIHIPGSDRLFNTIVEGKLVPVVPSLAGSTLGVRYDISSFAALKFEYRNQRRPGEPRVNGAFAQTSFTF